MSHVHDTVTLYHAILAKILAEDEIGHDKNGYYLAASGNVAWAEIYQATAEGLFKRGVVEDAAVSEVSGEALEQMAQALCCPKEFVPVQMGGK